MTFKRPTYCQAIILFAVAANVSLAGLMYAVATGLVR